MKNISFWNTKELEETENIRCRCDRDYVEAELKKLFPEEKLHVISTTVNETGHYKNPIADTPMGQFGSGFHIEGLPAYCEVQLEHETPGNHIEHIIIWSPLKWNDRFLGTGGGAASTGGITEIKKSENYNRGMTVPNAVCNGFTAATTDAGNVSFIHDWALNAKTNTLEWERIENWRARSTHWMTVIGKAIAEILHQRKSKFSYFHGGSGGGRQAMVEAQEFPEDYDGIWATSPAINWTRSLLTGLWPIAVMNSNGQNIGPAKLEAFRLAVHESVGGSDTYYSLKERVEFDPTAVVGLETTEGIITELDAIIMKEIWDGPHRTNGEHLWYCFRPGALFWNALGVPFTAFYYEPGQDKPHFFPFYARWVVRDATYDFSDITKEEFEKLFDQSMTLFAVAAGDSVDLKKFAKSGGKMMIDHGLDDPLIVPDGTIDYYERLCQYFGGIDKVKEFCHLYLTPGDGHVSCNWHGPGLTESEGMKALIDWVEHNNTPERLSGVQVHQITGEIIAKRDIIPV